MIAVFFFYGLAFFILGLAAALYFRGGSDMPLRNQLHWLAAFGFAYAAIGWLDMFLATGLEPEAEQIVQIFKMILQPTSGLLLLLFGWGALTKATPLPAWTHLLPGLLIVPIAYVITYAATTFITPSPIQVPIDIWSRYLLYLPGSIMAGIGFLRQWRAQSNLGYHDVARLMLAAGVAFLFEAVVVGLVVPAAPTSPASYYNYDRTIYDAFTGEQPFLSEPFGLTNWLDYDRVLEVTGLPIQFWRMISAFAVTLFIVRGLGVFDAIRKRQMQSLQVERDRAQQSAMETQIAARKTAERWTDALIDISRHITELNDVDDILLYIVENGRFLLHANFMGLALINDELTGLELRYYANDTQSSIVETAVPVDNPLILSTLRHKTSYHDKSPAELENLCFFTEQQAKTVTAVRLSLDANHIGVLWLARYEADPFTDTDLILLESLADQVVIAIQHGLMTSQLQSFSVIEERSRIAREMHDGLAQVLGYLNLQVQTLETLRKRGKWDALQSELAQMREAVQTAHADVRENILSLRTTLANEKGLISAIDEYLNEFSIQTQIKTQFINEVEGALNIASLAEVQLVCILQEALANVRKHAHANKVSITIKQQTRSQAEFLLMEVTDDGVGFNGNNSNRSFGLQTMHERALTVGGELTVRSAPDSGTTVICCLPCLPEEKLRRQKPSFSIMNVREWALPIYTILMQLAAGTLLSLWTIRAAGLRKHDRDSIDLITRLPVLAILITIVLAMGGAHLHLSRPFFSPVAILNFGSLWLSREIFFTILFFLSTAVLTYLMWFEYGRFPLLKTILGWFGSATGSLAVFCMSMIYLIPTQASWNSPLTVLAFLSSVFLLGVTAVSVLLVIDLKVTEVGGGKETAVRRQLIRQSFYGLNGRCRHHRNRHPRPQPVPHHHTHSRRHTGTNQLSAVARFVPAAVRPSLHHPVCKCRLV